MKVKATILIIKKLDFGFSAKGFTRLLGRKMASPKKNMKSSQTFYISSLMYLQSFWLRNMHLKTTFFISILQKKAIIYEWVQLRQGQINGSANDAFDMKCISQFYVMNAYCWTDTSRNGSKQSILIVVLRFLINYYYKTISCCS